MKIKRKYYDLKLKAGYIITGIKTVKIVHLMDDVVYKGERYFVNNGTSYPKWDLIKFTDPYPRKSILVHQDDFKKEKSWANLKRGIFSNYEFQMSYWHKIDLRKLMEEE